MQYVSTSVETDEFSLTSVHNGYWCVIVVEIVVTMCCTQVVYRKIQFRCRGHIDRPVDCSFSMREVLGSITCLSSYCDKISWNQHFPNVHFVARLRHPLTLSNILLPYEVFLNASVNSADLFAPLFVVPSRVLYRLQIDSSVLVRRGLKKVENEWNPRQQIIETATHIMTSLDQRKRSEAYSKWLKWKWGKVHGSVVL